MCSVSPGSGIFRFSPRLGRRSSRRGFILISVLLLSVIFISCATVFAWFSRLQIKNTSREKISLENRSMAQVLTSAIIQALKANTMVKYDSPNLEWFKPFLFPAGDLGIWVVQVTPLDDKIPIRNLFLPDGNTQRNELKKTWEDLWVKLGQRDLMYAALDFMDKDTKPRMGGAEREHYINRPPLDMSEFLLVEGMTPELLYGKPNQPGLADYCTLWSGGKLNLNVASIQVMAILPGLDETLADKIAEYREQNALKGTADLRNIPGFPPRAITTLMNLAAFNSQYFSIRIESLEDGGGGTSFKIVIDKTAGQVVRWEEI